MDRILNMIVNRVIGRVINRGVDAGINAVTRRGAAETPEDQARADATARNTKGIFRMARRIGRF